MNVEKYNYCLEITHTIKDKLECPVDEGIRHTVAAFLYAGFKTDGSCEGHLDWGLPYPWIDLNTNKKDRARIDSILQEYTANHDGYLYLKSVDFGNESCRIIHYDEISSRGLKNKKLLEFLQDDMNKFADFLIKNADKK